MSEDYDYFINVMKKFFANKAKNGEVDIKALIYKIADNIIAEVEKDTRFQTKGDDYEQREKSN